MIEQWITQRLGNISYSYDGEDIRVNCPFCKARWGSYDTNKHLSVSVIRPFVHCFRCDWSGNYIGLVMSVDGCTYFEALQHLEKTRPNISKFTELSSERGLVQGAWHMEQPEGFLPVYPAWKGCPVEQRAIMNYLVKNRRLGARFNYTCFGWILGTNRVWILIDRMWWQGRVLGKGKPKYISPPWPRGDSLWNHKVLIKGYSRIDVCEGVFSAIACGPHAVAICGKRMTKPQAGRLVKANKSIRIVFDSGAEEEAHYAADLLLSSGHERALKIYYLNDGDPCDSMIGRTVNYNWRHKVKYALA